MSLFSTKQNENRNNGNGSRYRPTESARVNSSTEVDVFVTDNGTYWGLSRVNEEGGRSFRTMKPAQLGDAVEAIAFLSKVLAQDPECPVDLKSFLSELEKSLNPVVEMVKRGFQVTNGETPRTGLLTA